MLCHYVCRLTRMCCLLVCVCCPLVCVVHSFVLSHYICLPVCMPVCVDVCSLRFQRDLTVMLCAGAASYPRCSSMFAPSFFARFRFRKPPSSNVYSVLLPSMLMRVMCLVPLTFLSSPRHLMHFMAHASFRVL